MSPNIRWATNLITFANTTIWGLDAGLTHPQWSAAFRAEPLRYFEAMFALARDAGLEGVELAPDPALWDVALEAFGSPAAIAAALTERELVCSSAYAPGRQLIGDAMADPSAQQTVDRYVQRMSQFLADMGANVIVMGNIARSRFGNDSPDDTATAEDFSRPVPPEVHEKFADQVNRLGSIAGRYGVAIAVHTDAYSVCSRNADVARVLELTDPATVGICLDAGHVALDGGDPVRMLHEHLGRIPTMHWKDCCAPLGGHTLRGDQKERHAVMLKNFRVLGSGSVDWIAWMDILRAAQWQGWAIEEIDNSADPVGELRQGLQYFQSKLAPIYR